MKILIKKNLNYKENKILNTYLSTKFKVEMIRKRKLIQSKQMKKANQYMSLMTIFQY